MFCVTVAGAVGCVESFLGTGLNGTTEFLTIRLTTTRVFFTMDSLSVE